jgi:hypothetical protein
MWWVLFLFISNLVCALLFNALYFILGQSVSKMEENLKCVVLRIKQKLEIIQKLEEGTSPRYSSDMLYKGNSYLQHLEKLKITKLINYTSSSDSISSLSK